MKNQWVGQLDYDMAFLCAQRVGVPVGKDDHVRVTAQIVDGQKMLVVVVHHPNGHVTLYPVKE